MIELELSDEEMEVLRIQAAAHQMTSEEFVIKILEKDPANDDAKIKNKLG